ncbi:MAG: PqqD family peptide modification chaperone [Halobacteriota archaeon]
MDGAWLNMAQKIALDTTIVASKSQVSADLGGEAVILNLESGIYYELDPVGARIWKLIQEPRRVREVRDALLEEYDVDGERSEKGLIMVLTELARKGLLDIVDSW